MEQSSFGRLLSVLVSPGRTFEVLRERPTWVWALVVLVGLTALSTTIVFQRIDQDAQRDQMYEQLERRGVQGTEADQQVETITAFNEKWWPVFVVGAVVISVVGILLVALFFFMGLRFIGGSSLGFRQSLATTTHAMMPQVVSGILSLAILWPREAIDPQAMQRGEVGLITNLGRFAPDGASPIVQTLYASVDIVTFWVLALLVLGYSIVGRVSKGMAAILAIGGWLFWVLVKVGLAALGQSFGG